MPAMRLTEPRKQVSITSSPRPYASKICIQEGSGDEVCVRRLPRKEAAWAGGSWLLLTAPFGVMGCRHMDAHLNVLNGAQKGGQRNGWREGHAGSTATHAHAYAQQQHQQHKKGPAPRVRARCAPRPPRPLPTCAPW